MKSVYRLCFFLILSGYIFAGCNKGEETAEPDFVIGQSYQGGIIFYLDSSGTHGLIAAASDQSTSAKWCGDDGNDSVRTEATYADIGKGQFNTTAIVKKIGAGTYAASICDKLAIAGYDDWFLPSTEELTLMYDQKEKIGNFSDNWYWTSTDLLGQPRANYARNLHFSTGDKGMNANMFKSALNSVRAIRAF